MTQPAQEQDSRQFVKSPASSDDPGQQRQGRHDQDRPRHEAAPAPSPGPRPGPHGDSVLATAGSTFAGIMLVIVGCMQVAMGIVGMARGRFYLTVDDELFEFSTVGWGWIHLILGGLLVVAGIGVLAGRDWAMITATVLAIFSAVNNFLFLPHYPLWSIVVIAVDVLVIWSLVTRLRLTPGTDR